MWDPHNLCLVARRAPKQPSKEVQVNNLWLRLNRKCLSHPFLSQFNFLTLWWKSLDNIFFIFCVCQQLFCSRLGNGKVPAAWTSETANASPDNEGGNHFPPVTMEGQLDGWSFYMTASQ